MARIGDVWDSTVDAARGRAGVIAPVAALAFLVPGVLQNAVAAFGDPASPVTGGLFALVALVALVAAIWGQLAIIAIATDPATTRADAIALAWRRFFPALGNGLLLGLIAMVALIPIVVALGLSGINWSALANAQPGSPPDLSGASSGAIIFALLYFLAFIAFAFWLGARAILTYAVVLNERRGAGAIGRSIALTRGMTWKIIGVLLLYVVVVGVVTFAVQSIAFFLVRLPLGAEHLGIATFVGAVFGAIASTALVALFCVFTARLYVATAGAAPVRGVDPAA